LLELQIKGGYQFRCKNYNINKDSCKRLKGECVQGRKGCPLEGRVALREELEEKIRKIDKRPGGRA